MTDERSLLEKLGGKSVLDEIVDQFYGHVMEDERINHFFKDLDMERQLSKQKAFLTYAFGEAPDYSGVNLKEAHKNLVKEKGLSEVHFNALIENLVRTLEEMNIHRKLITAAIIILKSKKKDVLGA